MTWLWQNDRLRTLPRNMSAVMMGVILLLILILFFNQALVGNHVLNAADGVFVAPFFADLAPASFRLPSNPTLFDQVYQFTPWRYFAWKSIRNGELPLWNPYSYTGTPFVATMQSAVLFPVNLILTAIPFESTFVWSAIIRLWIAGMSTYALARRYKLNLFSSFIGAVSFMFCGFIITRLGHPHTNVAVWLPLLILGAEYVITSNLVRLRIFGLAVLSLIIAIQFLGGHLETSVNILFACCLYWLVRWLQIFGVHALGIGRNIGVLLLLVLPLMLGAAAAAVQLLPFFEWVTRSAVLSERAQRGFQLLNTGAVMELLSLPVILFPNIYNNPTWDYPYYSFLLSWGDYNSMAMYCGILTLVLACIALIKRRLSANKALIDAWIIVGVVSFGRAFSLPVFDWINQLPGLGLGSASRNRLIVSFSLCLLAAFGAQILCDHNVRPLKRTWLVLTGSIVVVGFAIMIASNIALPLAKDTVAQYGRQLVDVEFAARSTHSNTLEYYYGQVDQMVAGLLAAFNPRNIQMYYPIVWAAIGFLLVWINDRFQYINVKALLAILSVVVGIDMFTFGYGYNPTIASQDFYPETAVIAKLRDTNSPNRIMALRQDLLPDAQLMYELSDIRGLDYPLQTLREYFKLIPERISWLSYGEIFSSAESPLLKVLNLKYVIASDPDQLEVDQDINKIERVDGMYVGEVAKPQPRAYMVYEAEEMDSEQAAEIRLAQQPDAVFKRVLLSKDSENKAPAISDISAIPVSDVTPITSAPNRSTWRVSTSHDGYLVLSETYYPGWQAFLDDQAVPLYRANIAFRAVYVPKGEHIVNFRYDPVSLRLGTIATAASVVIISLMTVWSLPWGNRALHIEVDAERSSRE